MLSFRRQRLEELGLDGHSWTTPATFEDGAALFDAVCERGPRGRHREAAAIAVPAGEAHLGEDQEPRLLAPRVRDRRDAVQGGHADGDKWPKRT